MDLMSGKVFSPGFGIYFSLKCLLRNPLTEFRMQLNKPLIPNFAGHTIFNRMQNVVSHCEFEYQAP